jgi:hypothetical protein
MRGSTDAQSSQSPSPGVGNADRRQARLSDDEFERLVTRAADAVEDRFYTGVGKAVVRKGLYVLGSLVFAAAAWFRKEIAAALSLFGGG